MPNSRTISKRSSIIRRILGIDPGSKATGYGIISTHPDGRLSCLTAGLIKPPAGWALADRLAAVFDGLNSIIEDYKPDEAAIEDMFFSKNVRSAISLGHVRGVAVLTASKSGLSVYSYPPTSVKKAVVGYGRAAKEQVGHMVRSILNIDQAMPLDTTDALACAICHFHTSKTISRLDSGVQK
jgi:crossover junction endodeoxyribonuclease RuvC